MTTIYRLTPITRAAKEWIEANVQTEPWQWLGENLCVETRFVGDLIDGLRRQGLERGKDFRVAA